MKNAILLNPITDMEIREFVDLHPIKINYKEQENSIALLLRTFPYNTNLSEILLKCCVINTFYSTNIFSIYAMAEHISKIEDFDKQLKNGDLTLIDKIAKITIKGKDKNFYSFATKYCSFHNPEIFPIYDSFVEKMLVAYSKLIPSMFTYKIKSNETLKDYTLFTKTIESLINHFSLKCSLKELDIYLWLKGKEVFS